MVDKLPDYSIEISSGQLWGELQEIKERLSTIESIDSYVHRDKLTEIVSAALGGKSQRKKVVSLCAEAQTRQELTAALELGSPQALDHILRPLREQHVILEETVKDGAKAFVQSRLLKKLPKTILDALLK